MIPALLGAVAITLVVTRGTIFAPLRGHGPRLWRDLLSCPLCLGVWVGAAAWLLAAGAPRSPLEAFSALGTACGVGCAALTLRLVWDALDALALYLEVRARK